MKVYNLTKACNLSVKLHKFIFTFFGTIFFFFIQHSTSLSQGIRFGIFFDPNIAWMKPDISDVKNAGSRMGFKVGLSFEKYFTENYAFFSGISIQHLGGKLKYADSISFTAQNITEMLPEGSTITYKLQYVSVPLGLKLKTNEIGYLTYYGNLGLHPQVLIKATGDILQSDITNSSIKDEVNIFNLGYYIGMGAEYSLGGSTAICIGLYYTNGFLDVTTDHDNKPSDKVVMNNVTLNLGIIF